MSKEKLETGTHTADHSPSLWQLAEVFRWLLGEQGKFPESLPGKRYNFRSELRQRLRDIGFNIYPLPPKAAGEADHSRRAEMPPEYTLRHRLRRSLEIATTIYRRLANEGRYPGELMGRGWTEDLELIEELAEPQASPEPRPAPPPLEETK